MQKRNKTPCEDFVWYVLPALRCELAKEIVRMGKSQKEASILLGVTESAVSQYFGKKRGKASWLDERISLEIRKSAKRIVEGGVLSKELCRLCASIKGSKLCKLILKE